MNRILPLTANQPKPLSQVQQALRPSRKLRADAEAVLRDIAFVLTLTRRVKDSMLHDRELSHA